MHRLLSISALLIFIIGSGLFAATVKSTTVVGFINLGPAKDNSINSTLSRSMVTFLQKIPGSKVVPYTDAENAAKGKGFFNVKKVDVESAVSIAQGFDTKQVVTGDYLVSGESIEINVYLYDVVTGELKFKKNYKGSAGPEIFDTIDRVIKNVSGLIVGSEISLAKLMITTKQSRQYKIFINGRQSSRDLSSKQNFMEDILAGEDTEISIRLADSKKEVFRTTVKPYKGETNTIEYRPSGNLIIKVIAGSGAVTINGKKAGYVDEQNALTIPNVPASAVQEIKVEGDSGVIGVRSLSVSEGESKVVVIGEDKRFYHFQIRLMDGGLGGNIGVDISPFIAFPIRFALLGGAVYVNSTFVPTIALEASYSVLQNENFAIRVTPGAFAYFTPSEALFSPRLMLGFDYEIFTFDLGIRYSFASTNGGIKPAFNVGLRF